MSVTVEVIEVPQPVLNGDWTVMVSEGGKKAEAISRPLGAPGPDPANTEDLSYLTVEKQFDVIKGWFGERFPQEPPGGLLSTRLWATRRWWKTSSGHGRYELRRWVGRHICGDTQP